MTARLDIGEQEPRVKLMTLFKFQDGGSLDRLAGTIGSAKA
jgi:hypothetical protein